ncbi:MAG: U32 family peptidase [Candidatus Pacebacteria bacterium]|nr:U32 family peptidase [Candidatus Paceibacterota bacterium]
MKEIKKIELLSPAKDYACGIAAINAGADAVYIGGPKFGARTAAKNSVRDIGNLIEYAHQFRVKVYVAINTILFDNELEEAQKIIENVYKLGADGIIIQDMGILEMKLPPIKIIASTQCNNYDIEKIKFFEKIGIKRVILARELSLEQIKEIRKNTNLELEGFVHGALCVSMSGQCYFSEAIAKRSANRGHCSQPCRLSYSLMDSEGKTYEKNKFLLSLKDLNLSQNLDDLIDAGLESFKIEGRLKDEDYVSNTTYYYRKKLDRILKRKENFKKSSVGEVISNWEPDIEKTFNRGFTDYFLKNDNSNILSISPKSKGKLIGRVKVISENYFILEKGIESSNGDGICFFDKNKNLRGSNVVKIFGPKIYLNDMSGLEEGMDIYRNFDISFEKQIKNNPIKRIVPIFFEIKESEKGIVISVKDEEGIEVVLEKEIEKVLADNKEGALQNIKLQFSKLGNTIYNAKEIKIILSQPLFFKISTLNAIRREIIEIFDKKRKESYIREEAHIVPTKIPFPEKNLTYEANVSNSLAQKFYERHGVSSIEPAFEILEDKKGKKVMTTKHCLRRLIGKCSKLNSIDGIKEPLYLVNDKGYKFLLKFDCKKCQMEIYYRA